MKRKNEEETSEQRMRIKERQEIKGTREKSKEGTERLKRNGMARLEGKTECVRKQKEIIKNR